jgi:hypothetical protein
VENAERLRLAATFFALALTGPVKRTRIHASERSALP